MADKRDTRTSAQKNRAIRQEALREQLSKQKHLEHVVEILDKVRDVDKKLADDMLARYKLVIDTKLKLINKYLPDLKAVEMTGEGGEPIKVNAEWVLTPVKPNADSSDS